MHRTIDRGQRVIKRFGEAQGSNWATIIAWNGMTAVIPIVLAIVAILGLVLRGGGAGEFNIRSSLVGIFPQEMHASLDSLFSLSKQNNGKFAVLSILTFMWTGAGLMGAFDNGLNALYPSKPRSFVNQKLISFGLILVFAVLTVPLVLSSSLLSAITNADFVPDAFRSGIVVWFVQFAGGSLDCFVLFLAIFYIVPTRIQRLRDVLPGAVVAGIALELFTLVAFPLYLRLSGGAAKEAQAAGVFFILMFFMYMLGLISMFAAALNAERYPGSLPVDSPAMEAQPGEVIGAKLGLAEQAGGGDAGQGVAGYVKNPSPHRSPRANDRRVTHPRGGEEAATAAGRRESRSRTTGVGVALLAAAAAMVGLGRERNRRGH